MPRYELLETDDTASRLKEFMKAPGLARLAVAFWGKGAVRRLGLGQRKGETRILCDLFSGGCDPDEIKKLLKPKIEVRYLKGLHAKLYCTEDGSCCRLKQCICEWPGGTKMQSWQGTYELNVVFDAKPLQVAAREWFDRHWRDAELNVVDKDIAKSARGVWKRRRSQTLLKTIAADPDSLRGSRIKVLVYNDVWFEDELERSLNMQLVPGLYTEPEWKGMRDFYDFYLDATNWSVEPGTIFMDFHWGSERATPRYQDAWRVRSKKRWGKLNDGTRVITCEHLKDIGGLQFPTSEQRRFEKALKSYLDSNERWGKAKANHGNHPTKTCLLCCHICHSIKAVELQKHPLPTSPARAGEEANSQVE